MLFRQHLDPPAIGQGITDKIHRPDLVRRSGAFQSLMFDRYAMPTLASTNREAGIAVKSIHPLVIGLNAFSPNQCMQAAITEPATLTSQFDRSGFQLLILRLCL